MDSIDALTDLTLLNEEAPFTHLEQLVTQAREHRVAAICVYPKHLIHLPRSIKRATVLNFPSGNQPHDTVLQDLEHVIAENLAEEIDYVFPYTLFLSGQEDEAFSRYRDVSQLCAQHHLLLKVILETGAFPSSELIQTVSLKLIEQGCIFLKTSTGKIPVGATLDAVSAILTAIQISNKPCGLKVSGGIRTNEQALLYMQLAEEMLHHPVDATWFRIGRSAALL